MWQGDQTSLIFSTNPVESNSSTVGLPEGSVYETNFSAMQIWLGSLGLHAVVGALGVVVGAGVGLGASVGIAVGVALGRELGRLLGIADG